MWNGVSSVQLLSWNEMLASNSRCVVEGRAHCERLDFKATDSDFCCRTFALHIVSPY
jgi:hypothetical protein